MIERPWAVVGIGEVMGRRWHDLAGRSWSPRYLLARAGRWLFAVAVVLPTALVIAVVLGAIWALYVGLMWFQGAVVAGLVPLFRRSGHLPKGAQLIRGPDGRRIVMLPSPPGRAASGPDTGKAAAPASGTPAEPGRNLQSLADVKQLLSVMVTQVWRRDQVIETLERAGARWVWSQRLGPAHPANAALAMAPAARECVRLHYRPGATLLSRYTTTPIEVTIWFDGAGRLVAGRAWQDRRLS